MRLWQWLEVAATLTPSICLFSELGMLTDILLCLDDLKFGASHEDPHIGIAQSSADRACRRGMYNSSRRVRRHSDAESANASVSCRHVVWS